MIRGDFRTYGSVMASLFDAHTVIYATVDNTPAALTVTEQTIVGRLTGGNITAIAIGIADNNMVQVDGSPNDDEVAYWTANGIEGLTEAEFKTAFSLTIGTDVLAEQTIGIADDNLVEMDDAGPANVGEYLRLTANGLEGRSDAEVKADLDLEIGTDILAEQTVGIADDNLLEVDDADAADNDYAKFTANGLEGRSTTEVVTDLALVNSINFIIDGGGSAITTGIKGDLVVDFACTITAVTMLADQSGSIVVDIWKDSYANYPPTDADSITAAAVPTISAATKSQDSTLTGWTTSVSAGDTIRFNVDSISTCTRVTIILKVTRT